MTSWVVLLAFVGCGKKDEAAKDKGAESAPPKTEPATEKPTEKAPEPAPAAPPPANPECKIEITGAKTATIVGGGGMSAASTSYWLAADDKAKHALYGDDPGFLLNCLGGKDSLNITSQDATAETLKLGPAKLEVGGKSIIKILGTVATESIMNAKGTVEITAFDTSHIAGKVELTAKLLPSDGEVKIVGEFDFKCPNLSGCGK